ncbi:N-(5'-phosphoribosyl)anthranilate isomerase [Bacillus manliponensis]|uniref:N-(5'-phosphoribosyl)anthranilate isomerase n=1 Tax=Bacillus manliponensis TaxID=574376 RepID=A0A073JYW4_9BACI|nr:phosphoribosylanthranilate isomerase [Bacillus manliponensis]KEK20264.1 N-(5'-phosphoribosyl)anthranilate isomerase [Bacillus manliponensis]
MKVKICGITDMETALAACEAGADAVGFVFAKSKREVTKEKARKMIGKLPSHIMKVGIFVNESPVEIEHTASYCGLTHVQLHGEEDNNLVKNLNIPSIKALGMHTSADVEQAARYETDFLLFDSPKEKYYGGNGKTFSWEIVKNLPDELRRKSILAGGLHVGNVAEAIGIVRPYMVDVSSGVETNGKKDIEKIKQFIKKVKECY